MKTIDNKQTVAGSAKTEVPVPGVGEQIEAFVSGRTGEIEVDQIEKATSGATRTEVLGALRKLDKNGALSLVVGRKGRSTRIHIPAIQGFKKAQRARKHLAPKTVERVKPTVDEVGQNYQIEVKLGDNKQIIPLNISLVQVAT